MAKYRPTPTDTPSCRTKIDRALHAYVSGLDRSYPYPPAWLLLALMWITDQRDTMTLENTDLHAFVTTVHRLGSEPYGGWLLALKRGDIDRETFLDSFAPAFTPESASKLSQFLTDNNL